MHETHQYSLSACFSCTVDALPEVKYLDDSTCMTNKECADDAVSYWTARGMLIAK